MSATLITIALVGFALWLVAVLLNSLIRWRDQRRSRPNEDGPTGDEQPASPGPSVTFWAVHDRAQLTGNTIRNTYGSQRDSEPATPLFPSPLSLEQFSGRLDQLVDELQAWWADRENDEVYAYSPKGRAAELALTGDGMAVTDDLKKHHMEMLKEAQVRDAETAQLFLPYAASVEVVYADARARGFRDDELEMLRGSFRNAPKSTISEIISRLAILRATIQHSRT